MDNIKQDIKDLQKSIHLIYNSLRTTEEMLKQLNKRLTKQEERK